MDVLIHFGFTIDEIQNMVGTNEDILQVDDTELNELIAILKEINCSLEVIKNILLCNPFYLTRQSQSVKKLILRLKNLGFSSLDILFDSNPYLLNMSINDLEKIYNKKLEEGFTKKEIVDLIQYNMFVGGDINECSN